MRNVKPRKSNRISLIIPAFKQEKTIKRDLVRIKGVMDQLRYAYEVIVVVDGTVDKTYQNAKKLKTRSIRVVGYETNRGKGYAIRHGMELAKGNIIAFIDSGMDLRPNGLSMLLEHFEWYSADIIVGSKLHPVSKVQYPLVRRILSFGYRHLVRLLFGLKIRDTQVGMKFFKRKVLEDVLPRLQTDRFAFDIEMLAVAYHFGYKRIYEAPIELNFKGMGSVISKNVGSVILSMLWETFIIFYRLKVIRMYDKPRYRGKTAMKKTFILEI